MRQYLFDLWRDAIYALRVLAQAAGFTAVGIVSLTLGIGVCSVFYSEINSMVLRPLPVARHPEDLVALETLCSYPYFEGYRDQSAVAASATAFVGPVPFSVALDSSAGTKTARVFGHLVSPEYFTTLGVEPAMGRFFRGDLEKEGTAPVAVVSDRLWRARLNADRHVIGQRLRLNGKSVTIIGVAPKDFLGVFPIAPADVFVPVTSGAPIAPELRGDALHRRDLALFRVVGRLAPGVERAGAEAAFDAVKRHLDDEGAVPESERKGRQVRLLSASGMMPMPAEQRAMTYSFMAVLMGLILSLACTNLANLLLARGSQRRKEIAIRIAVGANRFRLVRQLLTESVLLALAGGAGSYVFTYWLTIQPRWRVDSRELFFVDADGKMNSVTVKAVSGTKPSFEASAPLPLFDSHIVDIPVGFEYDVTADGKRFLVDHQKRRRLRAAFERGGELERGIEEVSLRSLITMAEVFV